LSAALVVAVGAAITGLSFQGSGVPLTNTGNSLPVTAVVSVASASAVPGSGQSGTGASSTTGAPTASPIAGATTLLPTGTPTSTARPASPTSPEPGRTHSAPTASPRPVTTTPAKPCPNPPQPPATYPPLSPGPPPGFTCPVVLFDVTFGTAAIAAPVPSTGSQTCVSMPVHISDTGVGNIRDIDVKLTWDHWGSTVSTGNVPVSISDGQSGSPSVSACFPFPDTDQYTCWTGTGSTTLTGELFEGSTSEAVAGTEIYLCPPGLNAP
jgi:hypothetical protein